MQLKPAIKEDGRLIIGRSVDSHASMIEAKGLKDVSENQKGFTPDGILFLSRKAALGWVRQYEPQVFEKVKDLSKEEGLHSGDYTRAKGIEQVKTKVSLKDKKCLVFDKGLYTFLGQKLGESFGKVYYYLPIAEPYPNSPKKAIGAGLDEMERVYDFWKYLDKVDMVAFFDCYEGGLQHWLRGKGYRVFGAGHSEKMELDKTFFLETMDSAGLPVPRTYRADGLDDLVKHLDGKGEKWLKTSYYRGDFETHKYPGRMKPFQPWLTDLRSRIGERADDIEILVQDPIKSEAEAGYDGFCVDGAYTGNCLVGYEVKDKGLVAKVFKEPPEIIKCVNDCLSGVYQKLGYRGHYSTEIRITKDGTPYFIDPTCRAPSPPSELMCEIYGNYAEAVWQIAGGEVPELEPLAPYGAEVILTSEWHDKHELFVEIPKDVRQWVKIKNQTKKRGDFCCVPNGNGGFFGAVVALGNTMKEACDKAMDILKEVEADELDYESDVFAKAGEAVKAGEQFGIKF
jgi:hypothetical protein